MLQRLRQACRRALERYVDAASNSSGQLILLNPRAIDPLTRTNLARLQQTEEQAYEAYLGARAALLEFLFGQGPAAR